MDESNRSLPEIPSQASPLTPDADWPQLMREAALSVLGEPAKCHRGEWRYRSRGSLVVHIGGPRAGRWWDFESGAGGGVLDFLEQFAGLDRAQALAWLPGRPALLPRRCTSHPTRPDTDARHRFDLARSQWASSKPIPTSPDHPARRWLARRKLWWPSLPLPPSVRWLDARGTHTGAGGIIVLAAPPSAWADVWPQLPALVAVQLVHLDAGGQPALDRPLESGGLQKRTYGLVRGAALIIGNPLLEEALTPARVAEGLADTLALARRYEGPVVFTFGTSGLKSLALAEWLVGAPQAPLSTATATCQRMVALQQVAGPRRSSGERFGMLAGQRRSSRRRSVSKTLRTRWLLGLISARCQRSGPASPGHWQGCILTGRVQRWRELPL